MNRIAGRIGRWALCGLLCAAMLAAAPVNGAENPPPPQDKARIAVLDLQGIGLSDEEVAALSERLREALLGTDRYIVIDRSQIQQILDEQALQQAVCSGDDCATHLGELLGAKRVVGGKAVKLDDGVWLVSAVMVDVTTSQTLDLASVRYRGDLLGLMDRSMPELARRLTGAEPAQAATPAPAQAAAVSPRAEAPPAAPKGPIKLAIFPSYLAGKNAKRLEESHHKLVKHLAKVVKSRAVLNLEASFYPAPGFPEAHTRFTSTPGTEQLKEAAWEGLFITTPNERLVYQLGRKLGVDLVFMQRSFHDPQRLGGKSYRAYLFDVNGLDVYQTSGTWKPKHWGGTLRDAFNRLIDQYLRRQQAP